MNIDEEVRIKEKIAVKHRILGIMPYIPFVACETLLAVLGYQTWGWVGVVLVPLAGFGLNVGVHWLKWMVTHQTDEREDRYWGHDD